MPPPRMPTTFGPTRPDLRPWIWHRTQGSLTAVVTGALSLYAGVWGLYMNVPVAMGLMVLAYILGMLASRLIWPTMVPPVIPEAHAPDPLPTSSPTTPKGDTPHTPAL